MNRKILFWPLAAVLLTACEKGLVEDVADVGPTGQVTNSVLQITTRSATPGNVKASTVLRPVATITINKE